MLNRLFSLLFRRGDGRHEAERARAEAERRDFHALNAVAPVKDALADTSPAASPAATGLEGEADAAVARSVICREAVLNREQRVAGYQFMLRKSTRDRIHGQSRRIHHVYNEVLVRNLIQYSIDTLLGHRLAFIDVLDSFLANPVIEQLPGRGIVLTVVPWDADAAADGLAGRAAELRKRGFSVALEDCFAGPHFDALATHADYFVVPTARHSPAEITRLADGLKARSTSAVLVAKDLASFDDFQLCSKLGFACFQGPFVTSREDWTGHQVGPQTLRVYDLLNRLRRDAATAELADILKQDAVLSYRLLRYINSAASGLRQPITSIEHALVIIGRDQMYRWLTLLLFGSPQASPYAAALLENALVRGRLMELVGKERLPQGERDGLFVVGLFSLLDLVLQVPLADALKPLHLPEAFSGALLRNAGPYSPFLELAIACESFDQEQIRAASDKCGTDLTTVNACHFAALAWAQQIQL
jgi:c-di-GMP phosphodiesterase